MKHNQSTIPPATLGIIRDHIAKGEWLTPHLYLDNKGNPTIGAGFKIDTEDQFAKFNVKVTKGGQEVPATEAEKRQAYRQIMSVKRKIIAGNKNPNANPFQKRNAVSYRNATKTRMNPPEINARLDREIIARTGDIRKDVGDSAWNKLSPKQQAAIADLHFNTGSLKGFPSLKKAIKAGDAKAMAR